MMARYARPAQRRKVHWRSTLILIALGVGLIYSLTSGVIDRFFGWLAQVLP